MTCTASGGTVASSSLTGPGVDLELLPVGSIGRIGQNTYSVTSGTLSRRSNGDTYLCTAAADLSSPHPSDSTVLRGIMQIMCTCVRAHNGTEVLKSTLLSVSHSFLLLLCSPVATDPTIMLLVQVSVTAVRVEWSQPSGGALVTGYTIHYSDGSTDIGSISVGSSSTSADITSITNGHTYSISVEATCEHLSGESETMAITLESGI